MFRYRCIQPVLLNSSRVYISMKSSIQVARECNCVIVIALIYTNSRLKRNNMKLQTQRKWLQIWPPFTRYKYLSTVCHVLLHVESDSLFLLAWTFPYIYFHEEIVMTIRFAPPNVQVIVPGSDRGKKVARDMKYISRTTPRISYQDGVAALNIRAKTPLLFSSRIHLFCSLEQNCAGSMPPLWEHSQLMSRCTPRSRNPDVHRLVNKNKWCKRNQLSCLFMSAGYVFGFCYRSP